MRTLWLKFQTLPFWLRWPIKVVLFLLVVLFVLYPDPGYLLRDLRHMKRLNDLPDPHDPDLQKLLRVFDEDLHARHIAANDQPAIIEAVQPFVYAHIPYAWDWDVWGVVDYIPTVGEAIRRGREDCDGQAVVAAALLRAKGIPAELLGDPRHMWVRTPLGDVMHPLAEPAVLATPHGTVVEWSRLVNFQALAFGIYVFPLARELIILLALAMLFMPAHPDLKTVLAGVFLLFGCLLVLRMIGQIHGLELTSPGLRGHTPHLEPLYFALAATQLIAGLALIRRRRRSRTAIG